jgi:hypothetical protein
VSKFVAMSDYQRETDLERRNGIRRLQATAGRIREVGLKPNSIEVILPHQLVNLRVIH